MPYNLGWLEDFWAWIAKDSVSLFTCVLAIVAAIQGGLIWRQIKLARDEFNVTHRPKIRILALKMDWTNKERIDQDNLKETLTIENTLWFVNEGIAPAITKEIGWFMTLEPAPSIGVVFKTMEIGEIALASGEEATHFVNTFREVPNEYGKRTYCIGYIRYTDDQKRSRKTGFCFRRSSDGMSWERDEGSSYNYAY